MSAAKRFPSLSQRPQVISGHFQHYVGRICNTTYRVMHRSHSETAQLCILGQVMSFVGVFLPTLITCEAAASTYLNFWGRDGSVVCGDAHVVLHISDPPAMFSTDKSSFSQKEIFSQIMVSSMIFCVWMNSIFIGQFCNFACDSVIAEGLGPWSTFSISSYQMDWDVFQKCFLI